MRWIVAATFDFLIFFAPNWAKGMIADRLKRAGIRLAHSSTKSFGPGYGA